MERGRVRKAIQAWQEALELATLTGNLGLQSALASNLGEGFIASEQLDHAEHILKKAADYSSRAGNPRLVAEVALNRAILHFKNGLWEDSVQAIEEARVASQGIDVPRLMGRLERVTGDLFFERYQKMEPQLPKHSKNAIKHYRNAINLYVDAGSNLESAKTHELLANVLDASGRAEDAEMEREAARDIRESFASEMSGDSELDG